MMLTSSQLGLQQSSSSSSKCVAWMAWMARLAAVAGGAAGLLLIGYQTSAGEGWGFRVGNICR
jgi:hypothetical protein